MEPRRPRLARISGVVAVLLGGLMLINAFAGRWPGHPGLKFRVQPYVLARLDRFDGVWWEPTGWYLQETVVAVAVLGLLFVRSQASKPRPVPTLDQRSISDQLEDFEAGGITVRSAPQLGGASATTQAIVHSIIGGEAEAQADVSAAIAHLDTDETGQEAARVVAAAKMPQRAIVREAKPLEPEPTVNVDLPATEAPVPLSAPSTPVLDLPEPVERPAEAEASLSLPTPSVPLPVIPDTVSNAPKEPSSSSSDVMDLLDGLDGLFDKPLDDAQQTVDDDGMGDLLDSLDDLF